MVDWDALEEAGHDLTHCGMLMPGASLYYCENCGAFMLARDGIAIFHTHRGSLSTQEQCHKNDPPNDAETLKSKLKRLEEEDWERLRDI